MHTPTAKHLFPMALALASGLNACSSGEFAGGSKSTAQHQSSGIGGDATAALPSAPDASPPPGDHSADNNNAGGNAPGMPPVNGGSDAISGGTAGTISTTGGGFKTSVSEITAPPAKAPMYANTTTGLYSIDPATGAGTLVGKFAAVDQSTPGPIFDLGIDGKGKMFAVDAKALYAVNPTTAGLAKVMDLNLGTANGLTVLSNGNLVIAGDGVIVVDATSHALTTLVARGKFTSSGDIIALPDRMLYWSVTQSGLGATDALLRIDPTNGNTTNLGTIGTPDVFGLGYASGQFYGFSGQGKVVTINVTTGKTDKQVNAVPPIGAMNWMGATTNPVLW